MLNNLRWLQLQIRIDRRLNQGRSSMANCRLIAFLETHMMSGGAIDFLP